MKQTVYKVYWTAAMGAPCSKDFNADEMNKALDLCNQLRNGGFPFVTMVSENVDMVGKFGVSDVDENYEWKKEFSIKRRYKKNNS